MFLMSEFNPALVFLANIYADAFDSRQTTEVYANGVMQVSIFVSVNYNGNSDDIEDEIKDYVRDNVVILRLRDNGDKEEVDWDYSDTSNGFPHDIEHNDGGGTASDIRTPFYFTVPVGSVGNYRWIAKLGEKETNPNTPVTINTRRYQPLADGSQFEIANRVRKDNESLSVIRYKAGVFPDSQRLMKAYKYTGIKFTSTGGNTWLSNYYHYYNIAFVEYKDNYIYLAKDKETYKVGEYESTFTPQGDALYTYENYESASNFTSSEIEEAWVEGVVIVQCIKLFLLYIEDGHFELHLLFSPDAFELQDNFGNIVAIEIDSAGNEWDDWIFKRAIVLYP